MAQNAPQKYIFAKTDHTIVFSAKNYYTGPLAHSDYSGIKNSQNSHFGAF